ncbi:flavodoxin family protein [Acinetobacter baumannii]|uniref:flavodoxin family protein n=1 Tax=Acinetobacter baumannii TaxID=470 RepID=UPI00244CC7B0|nr:flavodoxin family protein [Acinetobacter baumannii]MDH2608235.1 flavodoxin family protein [Acinetobacter baumannii]MDO7424103.1 flavodoxin family protein [Acinetobacter baumannii]
MKTVAIIYHSRQGHTQFIAQQIQIGVLSHHNIKADLLNAEDLIERPGILIQYDGLIWGSPTYLGGVSSKLKQLMDATGPLWKKQSFKGKLAAGFTVSSLPAGDKQSTLISIFTFCMQHGMLWVGNPILPEQHQGVAYTQAANRLGSWSGLMAQAEHGSNADGFDEGDIKTAQQFGENFALTLNAYQGT